MKKPLIILITGATSGIGRFTALQLARAGHRVFATGRNAAELERLTQEAPAQLEALRLDVTDAASIADVKTTIDARTRGYGVDVLVNNAGYGVAGSTELMSDADVRAQYEVNVFGLLAVTRAFVPAMRARRSGRLINISSLGGRVTLPFFGPYNSTKYAVESLSDALRAELWPFDVHVSLIEPGVIESNFADRSVKEAAKYDLPGSPYRPIFDRLDEIRRMTDRSAVGPACVADAIERAATARHPRARYVAPRRAGLAVGFLRLLPTRLADAILRLAVGLTRRRFTLALAAAHGDGK